MGTPRTVRRRGGLARTAAAVAALTLLAACNASDGDGDDNRPDSTVAATGESTAAPAAEASVAEVVVEGFAFNPPELAVAAGSTVRWTNKDGADHTVVGSGISGQLPAGGTYEQRFDTAGTFAYACTIHPSMTGSITVS